MPEIKLPEVRLPEGLREMRREEIQQAVADVRLPHLELPSNVKLPEIDVRLPDIDLSKVELPAMLEERLPGRRRRSPIVPFVVAGLALGAAAWLALASPFAPRIRRAIDDLRARLGLGGRIEPSDEDLQPGMTTESIAMFGGTAQEELPRPGVAVGPGETPSVDPVGAESAYATYAGEETVSTTVTGTETERPEGV